MPLLNITATENIAADNKMPNTFSIGTAHLGDDERVCIRMRRRGGVGERTVKGPGHSHLCATSRNITARLALLGCV